MCQSQLCEFIKKEFCLRNFGLTGTHPHRFAYLQWRLPLGVVLAYRIIVSLYCLGWLLYTSDAPDFIINGAHIKQYAFLTMWTYLVLTVYFVLHCLVCVIHACERGGQLCTPLSPDNHRQLFEELAVYPSLWQERGGYRSVPSSDYDEMEMENRRPYATRIQKITWMLYNIASTASIMVTIIFWALLYPTMSISGLDLIVNFQLHAVTSLLVFIETILTAVPVRLLHAVYPVLYGLLYLAFSGVYYAIDHRHVLYPDVLDWSQPGRTVVVTLVTGFVVMPLIQLLLFLIYKLRMFIYNRCSQNSL